MSQYIAAYDIGSGSRRRRVATILLRYGTRIQLSLYQLEMEPEDLPQLQREIGFLLDSRDKFDLIPVDIRTQRCRLAWQKNPAALSAVVMV